MIDRKDDVMMCFGLYVCYRVDLGPICVEGGITGEYSWSRSGTLDRSDERPRRLD